MIGWTAEKNTASGLRVQDAQVAPGDREDVLQGPADPPALLGRAVASATVVGNESVVMRRPFRRSRPRHRVGVRRSCGRPDRASVSASVLWPVRLRNTSSRLGSRSAMPVTGMEAPSRARSTSAPTAGPFSTVSSTMRWSTTGSLSESGVSSGSAAATASGVASVTETTEVPRSALSSAGVPWAMTRPWSTTTMSRPGGRPPRGTGW